MFRKRRWWLLLLAVLVTAGAAFYHFQTTAVAGAHNRPGDTLQTAVARRGDITISATGAGTVIAAQEVTVSFGTGGALTEIAVRVGQPVQAGDILARVDDADAQQALAAARTGPTDEAISAAETAVRHAGLAHQQALLNQEANALSLAEVPLPGDQDRDAIIHAWLTQPLAGRTE